jgi:putative nucleotidyltransferase with HDIG domain
MNATIEGINQISFQDITEHLLTEEKPSTYVNMLSKRELFNEYPFKMLQMLRKTEQSVKYHPEGNVWNHTMLVLDEAGKVRNQSKDPKTLMWAALLHDIGKPDTTRTRRGRITSYDHDKEGEKLCIDFLHALTDDEEFVQKVAALVRYHMHMLYVLKELPYADTNNMLRRVDIHEIALLCRCDRLGRAGADIEAEEVEYREFLTRLELMMEHKLKT